MSGLFFNSPMMRGRRLRINHNICILFLFIVVEIAVVVGNARNEADTTMKKERNAAKTEVRSVTE